LIAAFVLLALVFGVTLVFATPPFRAPDEAGHFWRADALALGYWIPPMHHGHPSAYIPRGIEQLWYGRDTPLELGHRVLVHFPAYYTPLPHLPQALACFVGHNLTLRPIAILHLGRIFNLIVFIALMAVAMRAAPSLALAIATVGLLPMSLHLAASFSPDAMTIAVATLLTAMSSNAVLAAAIAFVKPVYFPIALMSRRVASWIACAVSLAITTLLLHQTNYAHRPGVMVDPSAQLRAIVHAPLRFIGIVIADYFRHVPRYAEGLVGRLGMLDVPLPRIVIGMLLVTVIAVALTSELRLTAKERALAAVSIALSMLLISVSQYLIWTPPGAGYIDGMQGRYFLPLLPLAMAAAGGTVRRRIAPDVVFALLAIADLVAIIAITPKPHP
jgi:uncharacterized membrane protein